jgi:hypothetical protein
MEPQWSTSKVLGIESLLKVMQTKIDRFFLSVGSVCDQIRKGIYFQNKIFLHLVEKYQLTISFPG